MSIIIYLPLNTSDIIFPVIMHFEITTPNTYITTINVTAIYPIFNNISIN